MFWRSNLATQREEFTPISQSRGITKLHIHAATSRPSSPSSFTSGLRKQISFSVALSPSFQQKTPAETQSETTPAMTESLSTAEFATSMLQNTKTRIQETLTFKFVGPRTDEHRFKKHLSTPDIKPTSSAVTRVLPQSSINRPTFHGFSPSQRKGISNEMVAGGAGGLTALVLIGVLFIVLLIVRKRRKTGRLIVAHSNTHTSFDNLGFTGGRKFSEYMDLGELELVRVKITNTVKRKISVFTKEDQKTRRISCGRLDLVEVPPNTDIDDKILLTFDV